MGSAAVTERPPSVWDGSDAALLAWAVPFYWRSGGTPAILDANYGLGTFWKSDRSPWLPHNLTIIDINPRGGAVLRMDNRCMSPVWDRVFDVVVYDPPHITDSSPRGQYAARYGTAQAKGEASSAQFPAFLSEAWRVLRDDGIVLAKIADMVHRGRAQWQHVDFIVAAQAAGFTVCDLIVKTRKGAMNDPKWKHVLHARKSHCFWIVARKGGC